MFDQKSKVNKVLKCAQAKGAWNVSVQHRNEKDRNTENNRNFGIKK